ncbi:TPA: hypothetical protein HA251_03985 [Candidatus Woesearchaeota archaeon]|nr:hypothetical protein [Candidatus Woesearchaeota archaeon]
MMKRFEIGGIDNSGKSTQITALERMLAGKTVYIPKPIFSYTMLYPQTLEERRVWYREAPFVDIVRAYAIGARNRSEDPAAMTSDVVLLDRGYLTVQAMAMGNIMSRSGMDVDSAYGLVNGIYAREGYARNEDLSILLMFSDAEVIKKQVLQRENAEDLNPSFLSYLMVFDIALRHVLSKHPDRTISLDASRPAGDLTADIFGALRPFVS